MNNYENNQICFLCFCQIIYSFKHFYIDIYLIAA